MTSLAGSFLIAQPMLSDPNFRHSVVLILAHDEGGAYGVVVNRRIPNLEMPVFQGGPCKGPGLVMLHGERDWSNGESSEVADGIFVGDSACLSRAREKESDQEYRYRLFAGYAGWGPGQLEGEIGAGAWVTASADQQTLFDVPPEDLWAKLRPPSIPQPSLN
jgi:putative transcriptional regulator